MKRQLLIAWFACTATAAGAQTIYRCGSTYGEQPCPGAITVEAQRAPTPAEAAASRKETERQARAADAMEKARQQEEAKPVAAYIPKDKAEPAAKPHQPEVFTAKAPVEKKKKPAKKKKSEKSAA